jgi:hypothetical protein
MPRPALRQWACHPCPTRRFFYFEKPLYVARTPTVVTRFKRDNATFPEISADGVQHKSACLSKFPKPQVARSRSESQPRAVRPFKAAPPALPFAAILRRSFDRYVLTGLPPTNEGEHACRTYLHAFSIYPAYRARVRPCRPKPASGTRCFIIEPSSRGFFASTASR